jgi:hypothetical protein
MHFFNIPNKNVFSQRGAFVVSLVGCSATVTAYFMNFESRTDNIQSSQNSRLFVLNNFAEAVFTESFFITTVPHAIETTLQEIYIKKSNKMQQCIKIYFIFMKLNMFRATHRPSSGA